MADVAPAETASRLRSLLIRAEELAAERAELEAALKQVRLIGHFEGHSAGALPLVISDSCDRARRRCHGATAVFCEDQGAPIVLLWQESACPESARPATSQDRDRCDVSQRLASGEVADEDALFAAEMARFDPTVRAVDANVSATKQARHWRSRRMHGQGPMTMV